MMINGQLLLTYLYLLVYICLSSGVILYNKWVLSPTYFKFPFPITLTMIHMGFSGAVAFFLVRILKVVAPARMTFQLYATYVIPISAFFASSLWFGNTAYLHISVAFIQMLKALMPVATFLMAVMCGTDKLRWDVFLNMVLISVGVVISSYGEIQFNVIGTIYQVTGIFAEALRLALTQVLLQKQGLTLNPITSLYYIAPCRIGGFMDMYSDNSSSNIGTHLRHLLLMRKHPRFTHQDCHTLVEDHTDVSSVLHCQLREETMERGAWCLEYPFCLFGKHRTMPQTFLLHPQV